MIWSKTFNPKCKFLGNSTYNFFSAFNKCHCMGQAQDGCVTAQILLNLNPGGISWLITEIST